MKLYLKSNKNNTTNYIDLNFWSFFKFFIISMAIYAGIMFLWGFLDGFISSYYG